MPVDRPKGRRPALNPTAAQCTWLRAMERHCETSIETAHATAPHAVAATPAAPRILVVEDEAALSLLLAYNLEAEGFVVDRDERGDEAEIRLSGIASRPRHPRLDAARRLGPRNLPPDARARSDAQPAGDHADGARRGGRARARALDRRRRLCGQAIFGARAHGARARSAAPRPGRSASPDCLSPAISNSTGRTGAFIAPARDVHLGPTEFRLLEYLMEKPGRVFSRAQLLDSVWGLSAEIDERTVDVHVGRLRKALIERRRKGSDPDRARGRLFLRRDVRQGLGPCRCRPRISDGRARRSPERQIRFSACLRRAQRAPREHRS